MKKVIQKLALAVLMVFGSAAARADLGWHQVYEVDATGTVVSGSVAALTTAITAGADVKVIFYSSQPEVGIPAYVQVSASGTNVYAHVKTVSSQIRGDGASQIQSAAYDIDILLNTNGIVSYVRYNKNGTKNGTDNIYNYRQRWLVNY
jgi:hypothetical protein